MKSFILIVVGFICTLGCAAQTMFFNKLDSTTWLSAPGVTDSTVQHAKQIPLGKWKLPKDSIKEDVTVWDFKDGLLTISYFNIQQKTETVILTYKYSINHDKGVLTIYTDNTVHNFTAGITSTGNNVLLIRKKIKKSIVNKP